MKTLHLIEVKYLGPTDHRGTRVGLKDLRFGDSLTIAWDYALNGLAEQAEAVLANKGYTIAGIGENGKDGYIIAVNEFTPLKEV